MKLLVYLTVIQTTVHDYRACKRRKHLYNRADLGPECQIRCCTWPKVCGHTNIGALIIEQLKGLYFTVCINSYTFITSLLVVCERIVT